MKIVKRIGVFETNSSSTHTLTLVSKADYEADKATVKPKYHKYGVLDNKEDKLLMACGCCEEMFLSEEEINRYASLGDEYSVQRKKDYDEVKLFLANGFGDAIIMWSNIMSFELSVSFIVRVYCELTDEDYDKTYNDIIKNDSNRYLHMKFFEEGALNYPKWDYDEICKLFDGDENEVLNKLRRYFDDDNVLLYREYFCSLDWDDDDDE